MGQCDEMGNRGSNIDDDNAGQKPVVLWLQHEECPCCKGNEYHTFVKLLYADAVVLPSAQEVYHAEEGYYCQATKKDG